MCPLQIRGSGLGQASLYHGGPLCDGLPGAGGGLPRGSGPAGLSAGMLVLFSGGCAQ